VVSDAFRYERTAPHSDLPGVITATPEDLTKSRSPAKMRILLSSSGCTRCWWTATPPS